MKKGILKDFLARFSPLDKFTGPYSVTLFYNRLRNGPDKNDSNLRQQTCWNAKKVLTFLLSVLTSDWLKQQKLTKLHKAVHTFILTFQPSSI